MEQYFSQPFPKPGSNVFTLLCTCATDIWPRFRFRPSLKVVNAQTYAKEVKSLPLCYTCSEQAHHTYNLAHETRLHGMNNLHKFTKKIYFVHLQLKLDIKLKVVPEKKVFNVDLLNN